MYTTQTGLFASIPLSLIYSHCKGGASALFYKKNRPDGRFFVCFIIILPVSVRTIGQNQPVALQRLGIRIRMSDV